jgi:outer membrane lipoprotein
MRRYLILTGLLLSACASLPPAIEDAQVEDVSYNQANADLDGYKNTLVRWGVSLSMWKIMKISA